MTLNDLERRNDRRRALSLRQLRYLFEQLPDAPHIAVLHCTPFVHSHASFGLVTEKQLESSIKVGIFKFYYTGFL